MSDDERPCVYVHAQTRSDDDVRTFYEVPEGMVVEVRARAVLPADTFVDCLLHIVLEREGALGEVARLKDLNVKLRRDSDKWAERCGQVEREKAQIERRKDA